MLLEVKNLSVDFKVGKQTLRAVNNVSFSLGERDSLGLVGSPAAENPPRPSR